MALKTYDLRFPKYCSHLLVGPSASGKTFRVAEILRCKNELLVDGSQIQNVVFFYAQWQDIYSQLRDEGVVTKWVNSFPTVEEFQALAKPFVNKGGSICIFDDFESEIGPSLGQIVRVTARHMQTSIFILHQSLFPPQKFARQISLNVRFIHLAKSPRENAQVRFLARQMSPDDWRWICEAFTHVTEQPFRYLLLDLTQECSNLLRVRSHYLPSEAPLKIYVKKGKASLLASNEGV